jgi:hypothetical protein
VANVKESISEGSTHTHTFIYGLFNNSIVAIKYSMEHPHVALFVVGGVFKIQTVLGPGSYPVFRLSLCQISFIILAIKITARKLRIINCMTTSRLPGFHLLHMTRRL